MSIGRSFKESLQKGIRSMEVKRFGLGLDANDGWRSARRIGSGGHSNSTPETGSPQSQPDEGLDAPWPIDDLKLRRKLTVPSQGRLYYIRYAFKAGWSIEQVFEAEELGAEVGAVHQLDYWNLWSEGEVVAQVNLPADGEYTLRVRAYGQQVMSCPSW